MGAMKELWSARDAAGLCVLCGRDGELHEYLTGQAHRACIVEAERDFTAWQAEAAANAAAEAEYRYADLSEADAVFLNDAREKAEAERAEIQGQFDAREWYSQ